jgi:hypothetical protein
MGCDSVPAACLAKNAPHLTVRTQTKIHRHVRCSHGRGFQLTIQYGEHAMLLKIMTTGLLILSGPGPADASAFTNAADGTAAPGATAPSDTFERDDAPKGSLDVNAWVVAQESGQYGAAIPGNIYIGRVDFERNGTWQNLHANVWIGSCSGDWGPCRRSFYFSLQCRDDWGNTRTVNSPWFRNESTNGYEYRNYSFYNADVNWCSFIDNVWMNWKYGW